MDVSHSLRRSSGSSSSRRVCESPHGGERRLELVGGIRHEVPPDGFQSPELRYVDEGHHGPTTFRRPGRHHEVSIPQRHLPGRKGGNHGSLEEGPELRLANQGADRREIDGPGKVEEIDGSLIGTENPGVFGQGQDGLPHAIDKGLHLVPLPLQGPEATLELLGHPVEGIRQLPELPNPAAGGHSSREVPCRETPGSSAQDQHGPGEPRPEDECQPEGQDQGRHSPQQRSSDAGSDRSADPVQRSGDLQQEAVASKDDRSSSKEANLHLPRSAPPGKPHVTPQSRLKLRLGRGDHQTSKLKREFRGGADHHPGPVEEGDGIAGSARQEPRHTVGRFGWEIPEDEGNQIQLPAKLSSLNREKVVQESPARDECLPPRQESDDGEEGAEEETANGQMSPSGTLKR